MNKELNDLVQYRIARAKEALEEAGILASSGHWNTCVNRLYYACFYAVVALFLIDGLNSKTHKGTKNLFYQNYILQNNFFQPLFGF